MKDVIHIQNLHLRCTIGFAEHELRDMQDVVISMWLFTDLRPAGASDNPADLGLVVSAAASAVTMANLTLGEELARFAWDQGGSIDAAIVLADSLAWQGRGPEAEAILAALDPDGTDIWATLRWGGVRAANLFFGCGRPDAAREVLATVNRRVPPGQDMYAMAAIEAVWWGSRKGRARLMPPSSRRTWATSPAMPIFRSSFFRPGDSVA